MVEFIPSYPVHGDIFLFPDQQEKGGLNQDKSGTSQEIFHGHTVDGYIDVG